MASVQSQVVIMISVQIDADTVESLGRSEMELSFVIDRHKIGIIVRSNGQIGFSTAKNLYVLVRQARIVETSHSHESF